MRAETPREYQQSVIEVSEDSINSIEKVEEWKVNGNHTNGNLSRMPNGASPRENGKKSDFGVISGWFWGDFGVISDDFGVISGVNLIEKLESQWES